MAGHDNDAGSNVLFGIFAIIAVFLAITLAYDHYRGVVNHAALAISYHLLWLPGLVSDYAAHVHHALLRMHPEKLSWHDTNTIFSYALGWWRIVTLPLMAWIGWSCWKMGLNDFTRRFSARSLIEHHIPYFPSIAPALQRDFINEPQHTGPWRMEESPIEWAIRHQILVRTVGSKTMPVRRRSIFNEKGDLLPRDRLNYNPRGVSLDKKALAKALGRQLGRRIEGVASPETLPVDKDGIPYRKALATAFILYAAGLREDAFSLLDTLSLSFRDEGDVDNEHIRYSLDTTSVDGYLEKLSTSEAYREEYASILSEASRHGAFVNVWMVALLDIARRSGELAPNRFIWLRAVNRPLWCALHQLGARTAWPESLAVRAHWLIENTMGVKLSMVGATLSTASKSVREVLTYEGWLEIDEDVF